MWQSILRFLSEWFRRPSWIAGVGIILGFLLVLMEIIWRVPQDRHRGLLIKMGLLTMGLFIVAGVLLYYFG